MVEHVSDGYGGDPGVDLCGGTPFLRLCLDFVNTEGTVRNGPPDHLDDVAAFADWMSGRGMGRIASPGTDEGAFLERARGLREALYRIFSRVARGDAPESLDLEPLNAALLRAVPRLRLRARPDGVGWILAEGETPEAAALDEILDRIAVSAATLLTSELLGRVKECASDTCSWLFIDGSRNRSRRWCDMADCGNRAKVRRYYRRHAGGNGQA